jgi:hypothetical protein
MAENILKTFEGIVNEVLQFGFNDSPQLNRPRVEGWVNEAQLQIARQVNAPEFQELENIVMVTGVYEYELPENFLRMQDVFYPELETRLKPVDVQKFNMNNPKVVQGNPEIYTLWKNKLQIFPAPKQASNEELVLHYIMEPPYLKEEEIPLLHPNYWHLLTDYAVCRGFLSEDDYEAAEVFQGRYQRDLAAYATDVQDRMDDRPHIIDGTWDEGHSNYGYR